MSGNAYNRAYKKLDGVRPSSSKQASAAGGSKYGSQISRSGSLHDTSNSWGSEPSREHSGRDQARAVSGSWEYPESAQALPAVASIDGSLYVASSAGASSAGASLERHADSRSTGPLFGRGTQDASRGSARMGASQGPMMGFSAVDPRFGGERRDVAGSSTNPFVPQGSRPGYIADPRALEFLGSTLPVSKADSLHSSVQSQAGASKDKAATSPAILGEEFKELLAICLAQEKLTDDQVKSVVSPGPSVTSVSIASSQAGSSISDVSVGSDMARAHVSAMSALQLEKETLNLEFEELNREDKRHIVVTDPAMIGLRGSVSNAPLDSRVYTSGEVQVLQTKLDLLQNLLDKKTEDLLDSEEGTRIYMIKTQSEIETLKQENVSLVQDKSKLIEMLLLTQGNACKIQEKLCDKLQEQNHIIQALTQCKNERCVRIKELEQSVERLVAEKRLDFSMQGEGYVCVDNPGEKMCIQAHASLDVVKAVKRLNNEILEKKLEELHWKQVIEDEICEEVVKDFSKEIAMQVKEELSVKPDKEAVSDVVAEAGAGPVAREEPAGLLSTDEKLTYEAETLSLRVQPYSRHAFTRILKDQAFVECLLPYPFFRAVFDNRSLKDNLHIFCEDIIREVQAIFGSSSIITNDQAIGCLREICLERKEFSPDRLKAYINGTEYFCYSCFPNGTPSANLQAFDFSQMSFANNPNLFFSYYVRVYVSWKTDGSELFAQLVAKIRDDK